MYKRILKAADQYFEKDMLLPKNVAVACSTVQATGAHGGSLAVTIEAASAVTLAATKAVTLAFEDSADGVTFAAVNLSCTFTFADAQAVSEGGVLLRAPLPDTRKFLRVKLGTTDAAASGKVHVFLEYLAR